MKFGLGLGDSELEVVFEDLVISCLLSNDIVELHVKARSCLYILLLQFFAGILARNRSL